MPAEMIEITLDGRKLLVAPGRTILEVAESQGLKIPTLCNDRRLEPYASCWVCLVKVEKAKGFVPSCGTRVAPGMVITTGSPDVLAARKMALELLLSSHYGDCKAPCTLTCPSNIDIQGYLGLAANGRFPEAVELIRRDNPMPSVIGRVCPHPCETACRRALVDEPLAINNLKRFLADVERGLGAPVVREQPPRIGKKAAVVGGGPAGLSAAWYLGAAGVDVTIFEAMGEAGGMLRYGIPDYRLPPEVLDESIAGILGYGAVLRTGTSLGRDVSLEGLRRGLRRGRARDRRVEEPGTEDPGRGSPRGSVGHRVPPAGQRAREGHGRETHRGDRRGQHRARRRALLPALRGRRGGHLLSPNPGGDAGLGPGDRGGARGGRPPRRARRAGLHPGRRSCREVADPAEDGAGRAGCIGPPAPGARGGLRVLGRRRHGHLRGRAVPRREAARRPSRPRGREGQSRRGPRDRRHRRRGCVRRGRPAHGHGHRHPGDRGRQARGALGAAALRGEGSGAAERVPFEEGRPPHARRRQISPT